MKLANAKILQLSRKYFSRAGNAQFIDGIMFRAAGMDCEADLAKQIHDLSYRLATALEKRATK